MQSFVKLKLKFVVLQDKKPRMREGTIEVSSNILEVEEFQRKVEVAWVLKKILEKNGEKWQYMNRSIIMWGIDIVSLEVYKE